MTVTQKSTGMSAGRRRRLEAGWKLGRVTACALGHVGAAAAAGAQHWRQLITDRVVLLNTRFRTGHKLVTPDEVYARHQVTPNSGPTSGP